MFNIGKKLNRDTRIKNRIGLDIGSESIKILEVGGSADRPAILSLGIAKIAPSSKANLSDAVKMAASQAKVSGKEVNISVAGPSLIVRFISMPKMKSEDLKSAIKFEAEKFIPFDINECIVDFQILSKSDTENKLSILLVAARQEQIQERMRLVEQAGFSVNVVDVDGFAIANAFSRNFPNLEADKTVALLNIGAAYTNLSIIRGGMIHFVRDVAIGSGDFNDTIARLFEVNSSAAEDLKVSPLAKLEQLSAAARQILSGLLDDIKLSFSYHENQSGRSIDEVYLTGAGSKLAGLDEAFQEAFGAKPTRWNPLQFLDQTSRGIDKSRVDAIAGSFAVACGLALR